MINLTRIVLFTLVFFGAHEAYPYVMESELAKEIIISFLLALIVVIAYNVWESRSDIQR